MFDFNAAIAAVESASAEHRDREARKRDSIPAITVEEANAEVRAMIVASEDDRRAMALNAMRDAWDRDKGPVWLPPTSERTVPLSASDKIALNEMNGVGSGLSILGA